MVEIYFYAVLVFISYYCLILLSDKKILFRAFIPVFVIFSLALRLYVPIDDNADYYGYYNLQKESFNFQFTSLFSEPYFPMLNLVLKSVFESEDVLFSIYLTNFFVSTLFFIWIAHHKDVKLWTKIILFAFEYFLITYTTIRNSVAYIFFGVLIYKLLKNNKSYFGYLGFLSHISALPALLATLLGFKKPTVKNVIIVLVAALSFSLILNLPIFSFINAKFTVYSDTDPESGVGQSIIHKIYFLFILIVTLILYKISKPTVFNTFYIGVFSLYTCLFFISPVMALRFSLYIIIYLCLYPLYKTSKFDKILNFISILLVFIFLKSFFDSHPNISLLQ